MPQFNTICMVVLVTLSQIMMFSICEVRAADSPSLKSAAMPADIENVLWWFPEDTETVFVGRSSPSKIDGEKPNLFKPGATQHWSGWELSDTSIDKLARIKKTHRVLLSVEGSRNFRPPHGLGLMPFEGCEVLTLQPKTSGPAVDLMNLLPRTVKKNYRVAGHRIALFTERHEGDVWTTYVASPQPNVLFIATNEKFLVSMLYRMRYRRPSRALSATLMEWQYIDFSASHWAVRHFNPNRTRFDPTSPLAQKGFFADKKAVGLAYIFDRTVPTKAQVFYLSANPKRLDIAKGIWQQPQEGLKSEITDYADGVVRIETEVQDVRSSSIFMLVLLGVFGHGIFL